MPARKSYMARSTRLRSTTPVKGAKRGGPIKRKRRTPAEMLRIYGPKERRAWVKSLGCIVCTMIHPFFGMASAGTSHNAHTVSGGKGRKADHTTIVPLCASHHRCYDEHRYPCDDERVRDAIKAAAAEVERRWQEHLTGARAA